MTVSTELFLEYKKRPGRAGLARLLERHQDAVYALCYRVLRHPQDAEDACQDVLLEVSRQVDTIEQPAGFAGWLYRTALHTALDVKRKRGRQKVRDAAAGRAPRAETDSIHDRLHQGLAGLDETSRMLVVEHYLAQRPLRELAEERGCSEVAVWKRIRNARERLRQSIGSTAMSALVETVSVQAPAGVLRTLALHGGLAMAAKTGIKIAIAAPLLLLVGAGTIVTVRQPKEPQRSIEAPAKSTTPRTAAVRGRSEAAAASSAAAVPAGPKAATPRSYPLRLPAPGFGDEARRVWSILATRRMTLDFQNEPASNLLRELGLMLGVTFIVDPRFQDHQISFKVADLVGDGCLRLLLSPREFAYEIRPDGMIYVGPKGEVTGGYEKIGAQEREWQTEIAEIGRHLDQGWDGIRAIPDGRSRIETLLRTKDVVLQQEMTTWESRWSTLQTEHGVAIVLDWELDEATKARVRERSVEVFPQGIEELSLGAIVDRMAKHCGLVACLDEHGRILMTGESKAAEIRARLEEKNSLHVRTVESLDRPVTLSGPSTVADLLESVPRSHGLQGMPAEEAWNSRTPFSVVPGATLRQTLDQIRSLGFRWAVRDGRLYVLR